MRARPLVVVAALALLGPSAAAQSRRRPPSAASIPSRTFALLRVVGAGDLARSDPLHLAMTFEARTYLHGLFVVEDRISMAHSLESRVPFLDDDLVDFASAMPSKIGRAHV